MKYDVASTDDFNQWFRQLRDRQAAKAVALRIERAKAGNLGDVKVVGDGVGEMRLFSGKGYRLYYTLRNKQLVILLCGGDKSSQNRDIKKAKELLQQLED
ncbi:type II toxin-antitoxin system RelE/ParE family toxin [Endozoicomonas sp. YOMI1]|uniref:type II toxin-antitoxin system RelE/ParE family toxin n=1 Tax=Endozoicomonas sp. YOMI1 TaxID=2828739 RepID=UPI0021484B6F|nr:type II toxin-antitoxin system RelE/ParE family toxin [Endozoicomonas sp. YOMI1]